MDFNLNFQLFENSIEFIEYLSNLFVYIIIPQNDEKINFILYQLYIWIFKLNFQIVELNSPFSRGGGVCLYIYIIYRYLFYLLYIYNIYILLYSRERKAIFI